MYRGSGVSGIASCSTSVDRTPFCKIELDAVCWLEQYALWQLPTAASHSLCGKRPLLGPHVTKLKWYSTLKSNFTEFSWSHHYWTVVLESTLRNREAPDPNLGPETGYPELVVLWFSSLPPSEWRDSNLKLGHNHFLPNPSQFIIHFIILSFDTKQS
jgi:hypothetical protein